MPTSASDSRVGVVVAGPKAQQVPRLAQVIGPGGEEERRSSPAATPRVNTTSPAPRRGAPPRAPRRAGAARTARRRPRRRRRRRSDRPERGRTSRVTPSGRARRSASTSRTVAPGARGLGGDLDPLAALAVRHTEPALAAAVRRAHEGRADVLLQRLLQRVKALDAPRAALGDGVLRRLPRARLRALLLQPRVRVVVLDPADGDADRPHLGLAGAHGVPDSSLPSRQCEARRRPEVTRHHRRLVAGGRRQQLRHLGPAALLGRWGSADGSGSRAARARRRAARRAGYARAPRHGARGAPRRSEPACRGAAERRSRPGPVPARRGCRGT